jgi:hypothetical protein
MTFLDDNISIKDIHDMLMLNMILHFMFMYNPKNYNFNNPNKSPNCAFTFT